MLHRQKEALEANLHVHALQIRQMELDYFSRNLVGIAGSAAMLAGFSYQGLTRVAIPKDTNRLLAAAYFITTALAFSCCMCCMIISTFANVYGPGLALRGGRDDSMDDAVEGMRKLKNRGFQLFAGAFLFLTSSACFYTWIVFDVFVASIATVFLTACFFLFLWYSYSIRNLFSVPDQKVTGRARGLMKENSKKKKRKDRRESDGYIEAYQITSGGGMGGGGGGGAVGAPTLADAFRTAGPGAPLAAVLATPRPPSASDSEDHVIEVKSDVEKIPVAVKEEPKKGMWSWWGGKEKPRIDPSGPYNSMGGPTYIHQGGSPH